jgi:chitodextrinase
MVLENDTVRLDNQPLHSVRLVKIVDQSNPAAPPTIMARDPSLARVREDVTFFASAAEDGAPALAYHWDFGDGVRLDGAGVTHTYTASGSYEVKLTVEGADGLAAEKTFPVAVGGLMEIGPPRCYSEPDQ